MSCLIKVCGYWDTWGRPCLPLIYLICSFRSSAILLPLSSVLPLALLCLSVSFLAFSRSYGIRLSEVDIHNGFAVVRWRGVPRFFFCFLSPFSFDNSPNKKCTCHHPATTLSCPWMPIDGRSSRECRRETSILRFYSESVGVSALRIQDNP